MAQDWFPRFRFLQVESVSDGELILRLKKTTARNEQKQWAATYHFDICINDQVVGGVRFRAENVFDVETYAGNLGYNIDPPFRGKHLAERACRLLFPLAVAHGFEVLWITCDPLNTASRKTCERLGAELVEIVLLPENTDMYLDGERLKCRYRLRLDSLRDIPGSPDPVRARL